MQTPPAEDPIIKLIGVPVDCAPMDIDSFLELVKSIVERPEETEVTK